VSTTAVVLLGVVAAATLVMAVIQVGLIVVALRLARKVERLSVQFEQDVRPLVAKATEIAESAARASSLAAAQVERADRLFADVSERVETTVAMVQGSLLAPAREGRALLAGVGAALSAFRELRAAKARAAADEEAPLFIG
jgi:hypothetical protein